jgi:membrane-bound ClpP family serine protease
VSEGIDLLAVWEGLIAYPVGGFLVVLIGTMLLFAEVLVKGRLILGLIGLTAIGLYFAAHTEEGQLLWMAVLFAAGIILVIIDGKLVGDGTLAMIGIVAMIIALAWPSPSILYGAGICVAFVSGACLALLFPKFMPRRQVWSKLALKDALTSEKGYNSLNEAYKALLHKEGVAQTDFRPTGTIKIEGQTYSATTQGIWVKKGTRLKVVKVSGTHILVLPVDQDHTN